MIFSILAITGLDKVIFDATLKSKKLLYTSKESSRTTSHLPPSEPSTHGVRLPKLDVPTFDGDILK